MGQNRETNKANRAQRRKKARSKREGLKKAAAKRGLKDEFEQLLEIQDAKLRALAKTISTVWNNQVKLQDSIDLVEEEFCVLGRLLIPTVNEILVAIGSEDLITEERINKTFLTWHEFKKRPDFKKHFVPWFLGRPLEELPPPPEPEEAKEEGPQDTAPAQEDGGGIEFGGDYVEGQDSDLGDETTPQEQSEGSEEGAQDAMPEGQDPDGSIPGDERSAGATLP